MWLDRTYLAANNLLHAAPQRELSRDVKAFQRLTSADAADLNKETGSLTDVREPVSLFATDQNLLRSHSAINDKICTSYPSGLNIRCQIQRAICNVLWFSYSFEQMLLYYFVKHIRMERVI